MEFDKFKRAKEIEQMIGRINGYIGFLEKPDNEIKNRPLKIENSTGHTMEYSYAEAPDPLKDFISEQLEISAGMILAKSKKLISDLEKEFDSL